MEIKSLQSFWQIKHPALGTVLVPKNGSPWPEEVQKYLREFLTNAKLRSLKLT